MGMATETEINPPSVQIGNHFRRMGQEDHQAIRRDLAEGFIQIMTLVVVRIIDADDVQGLALP